MRKMKLSLDDLTVESFTPAEEAERRGTVHARDSGPFTDECQSCGVYTGCGAWPHDGCRSDRPCYESDLCPTQSCPGYWSCAGVWTCEGDTCVAGNPCG
jgi:hypothetical protein